MNMRKSLLAVMATAFAFAALPALAAAQPIVHTGGDGHFEVSGTGAANLEVPSLGVGTECTSVGGTGNFDDETTGTVTFTFHGCTDTVTHNPCQTSGQPSGTIVTTELTFHTTTVTNGVDAVLITPNHDTGVFAHYSCPTVGLTITVEGNGILGEVNAPHGEEISSATVDFGVTSGQQNHQHVDGSGTTYGLIANIAGAGKFPATEEAHGHMEFTDGAEITTSE